MKYRLRTVERWELLSLLEENQERYWSFTFAHPEVDLEVEAIPGGAPAVWTGAWERIARGLHSAALEKSLRVLQERLLGRLGRPLSEVTITFANEVYRIDGVSAILAKEEEDHVIHLWTVVEREDASLRDQVYSAQLRVYDLYPDAQLDFLVLTAEPSTVTNLETLIPRGFSLIKREAADASRRRIRAQS